MNAFEEIVSKVFQNMGYWTLVGFKVEFSKAEKRHLDNHSMPRQELDIVAYKPSENRLLILECKSYLDSTGVTADPFLVKTHRYAGRYKLFTNPQLFRIVKKNLLKQLQRQGFISQPLPETQLCLVAGKVSNKQNGERLEQLFESKGWGYYPPSWVVDQLRDLASRGYEDEVMTITTKLLVRNSSHSSPGFQITTK